MGTVKYVLTSVPNPTANYIQIDFSVSAEVPFGASVSLTSLGKGLNWNYGVGEGLWDPYRLDLPRMLPFTSLLSVGAPSSHC